MSLLPIDRGSFFSGEHWPEGLPMRLHYSGGKVYTDFTLDRTFQGYENVVFGGVVFGVLDMVMWYAVLMGTRKVCMTRKTDMDFFKPVMCGSPYRAEGEVLRVEDRDVWAAAWIEDGAGERYNQATALFRQGKGIDNELMRSRLDFTGVSPEIKEIFLSALP